jgi:putative membrane protein
VKGPVVIDLAEAEAVSPDAAPPVPEIGPAAPATAFQAAFASVGRPRSRLGRWFWGLAGGLFTLVLGVAAWGWVVRLIAAVPALGYLALALVAGLVVVLIVLALREAAALARLGRLDAIQRAAAEAQASGDLAGARDVVARITRLYAGRPETAWGRARLAERQAEVLDSEGLLALAAAEVLGPLDRAAGREVEAAARVVAAVTAFVPVALADVAAALAANLRMIRRIAEIYGGRGGVLGSLRLIRAVMTHLLATGAVAVGDDLISSVAGGGILSKLSRRFGEGVVNGALTARVGVAAMEVCRPIPFGSGERPSVSGILGRALTGLFGAASGRDSKG